MFECSENPSLMHYKPRSIHILQYISFLWNGMDAPKNLYIRNENKRLFIFNIWNAADGKL